MARRPICDARPHVADQYEVFPFAALSGCAAPYHREQHRPYQQEGGRPS